MRTLLYRIEGLVDFIYSTECSGIIKLTLLHEIGGVGLSLEKFAHESRRCTLGFSPKLLAKLAISSNMLQGVTTGVATLQLYNIH